MAEVSDITIKRTQDSLGKLIKKPVLTDKLLRKPPFKFLHDIIHAVITTTGFLDGLYTDEELQSNNIKDRDAKIAFLQKAIDALKLATKQDVRARPSKIVAGLEADKTNEFLIAIAKAIDRKIDSTEAVELVKSGNIIDTTQKKEPKTSKNPKTESRKTSKESKESTTSKKVKGSDTKSKKTDSNAKVSKQSSRDSNDSKKIKRSPSQSREKEREKEKEPEKEKKKEKERDKRSASKKDLIDDVAKQESDEQKNHIPQTNGNASDVIEDLEQKPNIAKIESVELSVKQDDLPNEQPNEIREEKREKIAEEKSVEKREKPEHLEKLATSAKPGRDERKMDDKMEEAIPNGTVNVDEIEIAKSSATMERKTKPNEPLANEVPPTNLTNNVHEKVSNDKPRSSKSRKSHSKHETAKSSENADTKTELSGSKSMDKLVERPLMETAPKPNESSKPVRNRTALRSAAVRPISARPSAPRRRDRNVRQILHTESFVQEPNNQNKTNKKSNLPEFDDADNIVITETITNNISTLDKTITHTDEADIDGKQGHLVQQILETQTAILKSDTKNDISAVPDESILNDRKSITRNMTELRKMIQKLSLFITPLGKMMEYFQEDVDAMQIELLMWQKAGTAAQADISEEQRATEKLLENFKYQLAEINNSIKEHGEQINNTTMNIIQNEEKIAKLIATL